MARSSHSKQREPGTQAPLRPACCTLQCGGAGEALTADATPVDWTAAGTQTPVEATTKLMDDKTRIDFSGNQLLLRKGIYLICFAPQIQFGANAGEAYAAITNAAGTTIYAQTGGIEGAANAGVNPTLHALVNVTADATGVYFRTAASVAAVTIAPDTPMGWIMRIGNHDEP